MNETMMKAHNVGSKVAEVFNAPFRKLCAWMLSIYTTLMVTAPTLCVTIKKGATMENLFGGMADIIIQIAFYVGALLGIGGVFSLILAYKDDNSEGQSRAIRLLVIAGVLMGLEMFLRTVGIIS